MRTRLLILCVSIGSYLYGIAQPTIYDRINPDVLSATVRIQGPKFNDRGAGFIVSSVEQSGKVNFFLITNPHLIGYWTACEEFVPDSFVRVLFYTKDSLNLVYPYTIHIATMGKLNSEIRLDPNPKVDVVVIKLGTVISRFLQNDDLCSTKSIPLNFLIPIENIRSETRCVMGSEVFTLGFPGGKYNTSTGRPISKSISISSELGSFDTYPWNCMDKDSIVHRIVSAPKIILVAGLLPKGSSGGLVIVPLESNPSLFEKNSSVEPGIKFNNIIGIVSSGNTSDGTTFVFSASYILDLIDGFKD